MVEIESLSVDIKVLVILSVLCTLIVPVVLNLLKHGKLSVPSTSRLSFKLSCTILISGSWNSPSHLKTNSSVKYGSTSTVGKLVDHSLTSSWHLTR